MRYESVDDVRLRLHRSVVAFKGNPVHVDEVIDKNTVQVSNLLNGETQVARVSDLDLGPSSIPLGYVHAYGELFLTMRKPCRRYKQGLTQENFHVKRVLLGNNKDAKPVRGLNPTSRSVARTMKGDFADIGDAFQSVRKGEKKIVAFNREWAIAEQEGDLCLVYRGEVVGFAGATSVKLNPERAYLKESLELCLK